MVVPTADKMWYASLHQRLTFASATRGLVSLIRLWDCVVPTSGRNNSSRHAQKGLSMSKVSLEHSGVLLSCPLMRSGSPPRWIQIILSQLAQLPLAVKKRSKTIQLKGRWRTSPCLQQPGTSAADSAKLRHPSHSFGCATPANRRVLQQFDDLMADQCPSRQALW